MQIDGGTGNRGPLVAFHGAFGDTVACLPALVEISRRAAPDPVEVRGLPERLLLLEACRGSFVTGSIESIGWHHLYREGGWREPLGVEIAGRDVYVPAVRTVIQNLEKKGARRVVAYRPVADPTSGRHFSDHYWLEIAEQDPPAPAPELVAPEAWIARRRIPGEPYWVLAAGSGSREKNPDPRELAELIQDLERVVVVEGPADAEPVRALLEAVRTRGLRAPEVARDLDLAALAGLLARGAAFVGPDSGPAHIAAALGVPTVALFRATDPAIWAPRGPSVAVVDGSPGWPLRARAALEIALVTGALR